jgi:hypothetical protein
LEPKESLLPLYIPIILFSLSFLAPFSLTLISQIHLKNSLWKFVKALPFLFFLGLGITIHITVAFIQAIVGVKSAFKRTPKYNLDNKQMKVKTKEKKKHLYSGGINYITIMEIFFSLICILEIYLIAKNISPFYTYFAVLMTISIIYIIYRTIKDRVIFGNTGG